jgi:N-acetylglutamate synthase-like GNAT family acetyltransferase
MEAAAIRSAKVEDSPQIAALLGQLGYPSESEIVRKKISLLSSGGADRIWVAEFQGKVVGLLAFHLTPLLHVSGSLGRITAVVGKNSGEKGSETVIETAERWAWERDCTRIEVTSGEQRAQAHQFYQDLGYALEAKRFTKRKTK